MHCPSRWHPLILISIYMCGPISGISILLYFSVSAPLLQCLNDHCFIMSLLSGREVHFFVHLLQNYLGSFINISELIYFIRLIPGYLQFFFFCSTYVHNKRSLHTTTKSSPRQPQLEKACMQQQRPTTVKTQNKNK